ncbi:MAG: O-antigen ligase family protein [Pseudomonadota bacterium]
MLGFVPRPIRQFGANRTDVMLLAIVLAVSALLGGSSIYGVAQHGWIQLATMPLLLWMVMRRRPVAISRKGVVLLGLAGLMGLYALFQATLPFNVNWPAETPRGLVQAAQPLLGLEPGGMPLSLAPGETLAAVLALLPAIALFIAIATARWTYTIEVVCWFVIVLGAASATLALCQLLTGAGSPLYLYGRTSGAPGLFSNPNHQASFLVMVMPLSLALVLEKRREIGSADGQIGLFIITVGLFLLLAVGIFAAQSNAGFGLLAGIIPLCILLAFPKRMKDSLHIVLPILFCALAIGVATMVYAGLDPRQLLAEEGSPASRPEVWKQGLVIARDHLPFGTGLGTFEYVYPLYETEGMITNRYMNAAHNEYLQAVIELGVVGALLVGAGVLFWGVLAAGAWAGKANNEGRIRRAASLSILVVILHSIVDYPLHAPLYMAVAAIFAGILCLPPRHARQKTQRAPADSEKRISL